MAKFDWKGGLFGGVVSGLFGGRKKKPKRRSTLDPQQQSLYQEYVDSIRGQGPFADMYNFDENAANQNFEKNISRPAYRSFNENIIPNITGQFRSNNLGTSSYTGEALGRAGRDVQEGLDAQRSNMIFSGQEQAKQNKQAGIQNILGMTTFDWQMPEPSTIDKILGSVGPAAAQYASSYFGGPAAAPAGSAQFGSANNRAVLNAARNMKV